MRLTRLPAKSSSNLVTEGSSPTKNQLVAVAACCFCAGGLYGWSALIPNIESELTRSTELAGLIFSIAIVAFTLSVLTVPRLPPSGRNCHGCFLFGIAGAIAVCFASQSSNYITFLFSFSVAFGACSGAVYINALSVAAAAKHPTVMTPIMVACFGLGGAMFGPLWTFLVAKGWGLNALLPLAGMLILTSMLAWVAGTSTPKNIVSRQSSIAHNHFASSDKSKTTLRLMILLWLTFAFGSIGGLMVLGLASKFIEHANGTVYVVSLALVGVAIGNTVGRLSVSLYSLLITPVHITLIASIITSTGLFITRLSHSATGVSIGLIIVALGYGTMASVIPTLTRSVFATEQFAVRFSLIFTAWGVAGLTAPWIAGAIYDRSGSFDNALSAALITTIAATASALILRILVAKDRSSI